MTIFDSTGTP